MKLKIRFPGKLWPFGKDSKLPPQLAYLAEHDPPPTVRQFVMEHRFALLIVAVALIILLADVLSYGQNGKKKPLAKGQLLPELTLTPVLNNPSTSIRLSDYNDRLLILDFWSTICGTCIEEMPGVAALQKRYASQIKVVDIDFEPAARVEAFYGRRPELKTLGIPVAVQDTVLKMLFPHRFEPHVVWIDHGRYVAVTGGDQLNAKTVDSVLAKRISRLRDKADPAEWDQRRAAFNLSVAKPLQALAPVYTTIFTGFVKGLLPRAGMAKDSITGGERWYFVNQDLASLYSYALKSPLPRQANRRILALRDSCIYLNATNELQADWDEKHCYTFETTVPEGTTREQVLAQLLLSLRNNLGLECGLKKRAVDCLILQRAGKMYRQKKKISMSYGQTTDLRSLAFLLNKIPGAPPVVDECGKAGNFNIALPANPNDLHAWQAHLKSYDLRLVKGKRCLQFFVLTDHGHKAGAPIPNTEPILSNQP
jgi:thiol-disulfide isomerase/thioredoxin